MLIKILIFSLFFFQCNANFECPNSQNKIGLCAEFCSDDTDCSFDEKCCSNGCGHSCQKSCKIPECPADCQYGLMNNYDENGCMTCECQTNPCVVVKCRGNYICKVDKKTNNAGCVPLIHNGVCPSTTIDLTNVCSETCSNDADCADDEKCCSSGCKTECKKACIQYACKCPYGTTFTIENGCKKCNCIDPCANIKCRVNYECKVNPLTNKPMCTPTIKPGSCPKFSFTKCLNYVQNYCNIDGNCPNNQKCCLDPCNKVCMDPCIKDIKECKCDIGIPTLISSPNSPSCKKCSCDNPCQGLQYTGDCPDGTTCVNQIVTCIRAPCRPVASCEPNRCKVGNELPNVFCGRGPSRQDCPSNYSCTIAPDDRYAVCCPNEDPCKNACKPNERCVLQSVQCLKAPCPLIPKCLPECPMYKCLSKVCLNGIAYDKNGCRTCDCFQT